MRNLLAALLVIVGAPAFAVSYDYVYTRAPDLVCAEEWEECDLQTGPRIERAYEGFNFQAAWPTERGYIDFWQYQGDWFLDVNGDTSRGNCWPGPCNLAPEWMSGDILPFFQTKQYDPEWATDVFLKWLPDGKLHPHYTVLYFGRGGCGDGTDFGIIHKADFCFGANHQGAIRDNVSYIADGRNGVFEHSEIAPVPLPATALLLLAAVGGIALVRKV